MVLAVHRLPVLSSSILPSTVIDAVVAMAKVC